MGKKKWTPPSERRHHHQRGGGHQKRPFGNKLRDSGPREPFQKRPRNNERNIQPKPEHSGPKSVGLLETEVGITKFIGSTPGFAGVIKARFSDFQVNEIDVDGNEVKLTDLALPKPPKADISSINEDEVAVAELITTEKWERIAEVASSDQKQKQFVEIEVDHMTKEQRSLIHNTVKEVFGPALIGTTHDKNGKKFIKLARFVKGVRDNRTKWLWPGEYTYFVVHKENVDTMKAASDLASNMNMNPGSLSYAGTKDKRGKTSQLFSMRKRDPEKILRAAERLPHIHVGNFSFKADALRLGLLQGNRFRIALRHITAEAATIDASLTSLREMGFINYFGLQRFGNCAAIPTHRVGLALIRGEFREAVEFILQPRDGDVPFMQAVREHWWRHRDAEAALKLLFKTNRGVEAKLLTGLAKYGANDFVTSLENIPRNMRLMYIHAYQSLVWNEIASRRIELGLEPIAGDLVYVDESKVIPDFEVVDDCDLVVSAENEEDETVEKEAKEASDEEEVSRFRTMVRPLTADDIASGKYTIFDVVLPLPGHDITYPSNQCGSWYVERLAKDKLTSEKLKQKQKTYSLTGAYRKLVIRPERLTWQLVRHNEETDNLIQSDYELLKGEPAPVFTEDGPLTALLVDFRLPSSTYATMVLREILKLDTSPANQARLNKIASDEAAALVDSVDKRKLDDDVNEGEEGVGKRRKIYASDAELGMAENDEEATN